MNDKNYSWEKTLKLVSAAQEKVKPLTHELQESLTASDVGFGEFGADPCRIDWTNFRPLRLSREEDWSDWLAFLIERSKGDFIEKLLSISELEGSDLKVQREVSSDGYRADLIMISKTKDVGIHIEVKVGDLNLRKTIDTSTTMERIHGMGQVKWHNYLLVPESDMQYWDQLKEEPGWTDVKTITWNDVSQAIRKSIVEKSEDTLWRAWAYPFIGVIEQKLLNISVIPLVEEKKYSLSDLGWMAVLIELIKNQKV